LIGKIAILIGRLLTLYEQNKNIPAIIKPRVPPMSALPEQGPRSECERLDAAADAAIAACGGDLRSTIRSLILANEFLEYELETKVSAGYMRGVKHGRFRTHNG